MTRYLPLLVLSVLVASGCQREESIVQYKVAKQESAPEVPQTGARSQAWFFKLMGPADPVGARVIEFAELVRSVQILDSGPEFALPEGWSREAGGPMRFATLKLEGTDPPLEVAVSSLPYAPQLGDQYELDNLNRWRGQLGLEPLPAENWRGAAMDAKELLEFPSRDERILLVHLVGQTEQLPEARMLAAMFLPLTPAARPGPSSGSPPPAMSDSSGAGPGAPLTYTVPDGWQEIPPSPLRLASFAAESAAGKLDVSVSRLGGGGDLLPNINRWRGQVKLQPLTEEDLAAAVTDIEVGGLPAKYSVIQGEEQSILVAIVSQEDSKWFFKGQGPTAVVKAEQEHFETFLESIAFTAGQ
ncbi:MAG: hypothetical protein KDA58_06255 [Planctomycetaceae bacterium]|nr:hypothetical protein [Planctomycetaceae bacterium]